MTTKRPDPGTRAATGSSDRTSGGCDEYLGWSRRRFLRNATLTAAASLAGPAWMPRVAMAGGTPGSGRDVLVYILLRGGIDGLSVVVPYGDGDLYAARPNLAIAAPGFVDGALDLDGFFGLNPVAAPLLAPYNAGRLAFVHAAGSPDPSRSHFDAFQKMELGIPGQALSAVNEGWMARHFMTTPAVSAAPVRCLSVQEVLPVGLTGAPRTLPIPDLSAYEFPGDPTSAPARRATLESMYDGLPAPLGTAAVNTLGTIDLLATIDFAGYSPAGGATYPGTDLGVGLAQCAALIKADLGVEVLMLEMNGFDHHSNEGPLSGDLADLLDDLSRSLAAFDSDMGLGMDSVVVAAHSEFGRRVAENASLGTDHGHGGLMMLMGGSVLGGQVHGTWPGLADVNLDNGDLALTTDYRDVLGEILGKRLDNVDLATVFPGHTVNFPGVIA